jgi:CDP-diacylglycerol---glycerol-3-phosphate 3-phosphatidyltransferase
LNLPNSITMCRLVLIPVFLVLWWTHYYVSATLVFALASVTDLLDGYLARAMKEETRLGALLDPLVDKVLVTTGLILLVEMNIIPGWAVVLMLAREFLVTGLRTILIDKGIVLSAGKLGKLKTLLQTMSIIFICLGLSLKQHGISYSDAGIFAGLIIFWFAFIIAIASGIQYALKGKTLLEIKEGKRRDTTRKPIVKPASEILVEEGTVV